VIVATGAARVVQSTRHVRPGAAAPPTQLER
jgi:hypothetical protein